MATTNDEEIGNQQSNKVFQGQSYDPSETMILVQATQSYRPALVFKLRSPSNPVE